MPAPEGTERLSIHIAGAGGTPERLLLVERPVDGRARMLEWTAADWSRPATARDVAAADLLAELRREQAARRLVGVELYRVERWLGDAAER